MIEREPLTRLVLHLDAGPQEIDFSSALLTIRTALVDLGSFSGPATGEGPTSWAVDVLTARPLAGRFAIGSAIEVEMVTGDGRQLRGMAYPHRRPQANHLELQGQGELEER